MIALIKGELLHVEANTLIIETAGVGYLVLVTGSVVKSLPQIGSSIMVYTYLQVKEDGLALFGFSSLQEKRLFEKIITVSGAGPKTALAILSTLSPEEFSIALRRGDRGKLTTISGVGKKTAERLILELKEAVGDLTEDWEDLDDSFPVPGGGLLHDALEALVALGYSAQEAEGMANVAQRKMDNNPNCDLQEFLKLALSSGTTKKGDRVWKRNG